MKQCEQSSTTKNKHFQEFADVFCSSNLFVSSLLLLAALGVVAIFKLPTVDVALFELAISALGLLGVFTSVLRILSLVILRLSPVEGRRIVETSAGFDAVSLLTGRLSEVEGRCGVETMACC